MRAILLLVIYFPHHIRNTEPAHGVYQRLASIDMNSDPMRFRGQSYLSSQF